VPLIAVPNVSEGRDRALLGAISDAFESGGAAVLDVHSDPDHHRSVFTLAAAPATLARAVLAGARTVVERLDLNAHDGIHPRIGALDVAPIVWLHPADRGAACAEALVLADALGRELELPVYLYGALAGGRTRAELRRCNAASLVAQTAPDYGPRRAHPTAGAVLVAARAPLIAFNVELAPPATLTQARAIAAAIREGGAGGLTGVRALGLRLERSDRIQVSTNIEDHEAVTAADVIAAVRRHAPVASAELVAPAPRAALRDLPADVPLRGFDPARHVLENALAHHRLAASGD